MCAVGLYLGDKSPWLSSFRSPQEVKRASDVQSIERNCRTTNNNNNDDDDDDNDDNNYDDNHHHHHHYHHHHHHSNNDIERCNLCFCFFVFFSVSSLPRSTNCMQYFGRLPRAASPVARGTKGQLSLLVGPRFLALFRRLKPVTDERGEETRVPRENPRRRASDHASYDSNHTHVSLHCCVVKRMHYYTNLSSDRYIVRKRDRRTAI